MKQLVRIYPHMDPLQSTMEPGALGIYKFQIICICPSTNVSATLHLHIQMNLFCSLHKDCIYKEITNFTCCLPCYCHMCATIKYTLKCHISLLVHVQTWHNYVSIYTPYELTAINNLTRNTGIHTFHIIGISSEQNCLPHYTCMSKCMSTEVYI